MESFSDYIIDVKAIRHNILQVKKVIKNTKICAVVKADGYGVGTKYFVKYIDDLVFCYAVACFKEAAKLRKNTAKDILILNTIPKENLIFCVENNFEVSVFSKSQILQMIKVLSKKSGKKLKLHLAVNTGMNRIGFDDEQEFFDTIKLIIMHKDLFEIKGVFTHIYNAICKKDTKLQIKIFKKYINILTQLGVKNIIIHSLATTAGIDYPNFRFDMIRLGIGMYGFFDGKTNLKLKQTIALESKIIKLTQIKKGDSVGYGKNFVAKHNMKIATIPLGYADGIFRRYAKKGFVIINNHLCKIVGNICMDMFMCDVTKANASLNDRVIIIGHSKDHKIDCVDVAKKCDTICYEILTNIKKNRLNIKILS